MSSKTAVVQLCACALTTDTRLEKALVVNTFVFSYLEL